MRGKARRHVIKFANETLKPAVKNSVMADTNILTRKQLEKMSATQLPGKYDV